MKLKIFKDSIAAAAAKVMAACLPLCGQHEDANGIDADVNGVVEFTANIMLTEIMPHGYITGTVCGHIVHALDDAHALHPCFSFVNGPAHLLQIGAGAHRNRSFMWI